MVETIGRGVEIGRGYVRVYGNPDRESVRQAARDVANLTADEIQRENKKRSAGIWKSLWSGLTDDSIKLPFIGMTSPIVTVALGIGVAFASTFIAAVGTFLATGGLGLILIAAGAAALIGWNEKVHKAAVSWFDDIKKIATDVAAPLTKPLLAALDAIDKGFKGMAPALKALFAGLAPAIKPLTDGLMGLVANMLPGFQRSLGGINAVFKALGVELPKLGTAIGDFFAELTKDPDLLERVTGLITTFLSGVLKVAGPVFEKLTVIFAGLVNYFRGLQIILGQGDLLDPLKNFLKAIGGFENARESASQLAKALGDLWDNVKKLWGAFRSLAEAKDSETIAQKFVDFQKQLGKTWDSFVKAIKELWNWLWGEIKAIWNKDVEPWLKAKMKDLLDYLISLVEKKLDDLRLKAIHKFNEFVDGILGAITGLPGKLFDAGAAAVDGLIKGMASKIPGLSNVGSAVGNAAANAVKGALKVQSPSKVFEEIGKNTVAGFLNGMQSMMPTLQMQMGGMGAFRDTYYRGATPGTITNNNRPVNIGSVVINTQATDGKQTGLDFSNYLAARF